MTSTTAARLPLTLTEKTILKNLVKTLTKTESQLCCGGAIQLPFEQKLNLLYKVGQDDQARRYAAVLACFLNNKLLGP
jgi:hypothetical protein